MKPRLKEALKTAVIVLLFLSVVCLALTAALYSGSTRSGPLDRLASLFSGGPSQPPRQAQEPTLTDASQPLLISVLGAAGRASFWGDFDRLDSVFEALGGYLAEALDTAGAPVEITPAAFRRAVQQAGIYFRYPCDVPMDILAAWLDADVVSDLPASQYFLQSGDGGIALYLAGDGSFWQLPTEIDSATFASVLDDYPADGTFFALESEDPHYARLDSFSLVDLSTSSMAAAQGANPCDESFMTSTAAALGFNPYGDSSYQDDTGNVYTETDCSLRISTDGVLTLRNQGLTTRFAAAGNSDGERIEYVRSLTEALAAHLMGEGRLMLTGLSRSDGISTVSFDYVLSGLHVEQVSGPAVTARFSGSILTELTFRVRTYTCSQTERLGFLPAAQIAAVLPDDTLLRLGYADVGDGQLQIGWLRSKAETTS